VNATEEDEAMPSSALAAALTLVGMLAALAVPAAAESSAAWDGPLHGVVVDLPAGWVSEYDGEGTQSLDVVCRTPDCERTQEICTVVVPDNRMDGFGFVPAGWMVSMTLGSEKIRDSALKSAKPGTRITREPEAVWIGDRSWYVTETLAPYGWKSLMHATSVIDGRFVRVRCRTCERDEKRFDFAHRILANIKVAP
jgi:hypothetical protein